MSNRDKFFGFYFESLVQAIDKNPEKYPRIPLLKTLDELIQENPDLDPDPDAMRPLQTSLLLQRQAKIEDLAQKMVSGLAVGSADKDTSAVKATCKELGIKHTYKAIREYLNG